MAARAYVVLNRKGGVAKTSTCFHLAGALAKAGRKVLLADLDPQNNLTEALLGAQAENLHPSRTVAALFGDEPPDDPAALILPSSIPGVSVLPGSAAIEHESMGDPAGDDRNTVFRDFLDLVRDDFDVCLVDCPPNLLIGTWAALVAGDGIMVPVVPEDYGAQGLRKLNQALERVRRTANPDLKLLGYLISMTNPKLAVHKAYTERLRGVFGEQVFRVEIPLSVDCKMAVTAGTPVGFHKPRSAAAKAFVALAEELRERDQAGAVGEVA
jgi:chromosome partitioning protein